MDIAQLRDDSSAPLDYTGLQWKIASDILYKSLELLDPRKREAVERIKIHGDKREEFASAAGLTLGTVKMRLHRGLTSLKRSVERQVPLEELLATR